MYFLDQLRILSDAIKLEYSTHTPNDQISEKSINKKIKYLNRMTDEILNSGICDLCSGSGKMPVIELTDSKEERMEIEDCISCNGKGHPEDA